MPVPLPQYRDVPPCQFLINGALVRVQITFDAEPQRLSYEQLNGNGSDPESLESATVTAAANLAARIFHQFIHGRSSDTTHTYHAKCIVLQRPSPGGEDDFLQGAAQRLHCPSETTLTDGYDQPFGYTFEDATDDGCAHRHEAQETSEVGQLTDQHDHDCHDHVCTAGHHVGQACGFGNPCGVMITDTSFEGLRQHLLEYHSGELPRSAHWGSVRD